MIGSASSKMTKYSKGDQLMTQIGTPITQNGRTELAPISLAQLHKEKLDDKRREEEKQERSALIRAMYGNADWRREQLELRRMELEIAAMEAELGLLPKPDGDGFNPPEVRKMAMNAINQHRVENERLLKQAIHDSKKFSCR